MAENGCFFTPLQPLEPTGGGGGDHQAQESHSRPINSPVVSLEKDKWTLACPSDLPAGSRSVHEGRTILNGPAMSPSGQEREPALHCGDAGQAYSSRES